MTSGMQHECTPSPCKCVRQYAARGRAHIQAVRFLSYRTIFIILSRNEVNALWYINVHGVLLGEPMTSVSMFRYFSIPDHITISEFTIDHDPKIPLSNFLTEARLNIVTFYPLQILLDLHKRRDTKNIITKILINVMLVCTFLLLV